MNRFHTTKQQQKQPPNPQEAIISALIAVSIIVAMGSLILLTLTTV